MSMFMHFARRVLPAVLMLACIALAAPALPAQAPAPPQRVLMGLYVVEISNLDLKSSTFTGDFYVLVRSEGTADGTNFEVMNGTGEPCVLGTQRQQGATRYSQFRCRYEFHHVFDVADYPLDEHDLTLELEDRALPLRDLIYEPDREFTGLDQAVVLPGWHIGPAEARAVPHHYRTANNPTFAAGGEGSFSRLIVTIPVRREGLVIYLKSFLVMFLSVGIGLLGSALSAEHVEARLGIGVGGIFGVVSSYLVVSDALPETAQFTLADKLHLVGMGAVFLSILVSVMVYRVYVRQGEERAERLDRWLGWATTACFAAAVWAVTVLR
ncbi:MAG TPA: hypothetical protein VNP72_07275 [Longimicrobium sp.]|nr:hypothetical protein [Longimicrobium sp.]